jgi:hypothetical protein
VILRRAGERGLAEHGWLRSFHTFSFADYHDPAHMGFRSLRVINEDRVQPGQGFGTHGHQDMEIISYVLEGQLEHKDSMGTGSIIRPGDVQRMSGGTGVRHSEYNPSSTELVHFLQIWILPDRRGLTPSYEQKSFSVAERTERLRLVASLDGRDGSLTVHQDASLFATLLEKGSAVRHVIAPGRAVWVQMTKGEVSIAGERLAAGDAAAIEEPGTIELRAEQPSEVLLFDLG